MTTEPNLITNWMPIDGLGGSDKGCGRRFCEQVVAAINRDPDRRAEVNYHKTKPRCQVVDYSEPIKCKSYHSAAEFNLIIGWEPMEREA